MINMYDCGYEPTKEEIKILLKSLKPGRKLPLLNDRMYLNDYIYQLVNESYLGRLLEGYTLKFVTNRFINETEADPYLTTNKRLLSILEGTGYGTERRGFDLHFEWNFKEEVLLHNYIPNFDRGCGHDYECEERFPDFCSRVLICEYIESDKCIEIGFKINGTNIECHDYS